MVNHADISKIAQKINNYAYLKQKIVLWGASLFIESLIKSDMINSDYIIGIVDIDVSKHGKFIGKYKIFSPNDLTVLKPDFIISVVQNRPYILADISKECEKIGVASTLVDIFEPDKNSTYDVMDLFSSFLYQSWYSIPDEQRTLMVNNLYASPYFEKIATSQMFLVCISELVNNNDISQAFYLAEQYIIRFGITDDIKHYLPASEIFTQMGIEDRDIQNSCYLYRYFEGLSNEEMLINLFKDKSLAIVGNSPSALGQNSGQKIDNADIVVRFNDYKLSTEFAPHCGSKTDIWYLAVWEKSVLEAKKYLSSIKYLLLDFDYRHSFVSDGLLGVVSLALREYETKIIVNDEYLKNKIKTEYNIYYPSSGFQAVALALILGGYQSLDIYGFSFQDPQRNINKVCNHYYEDKIVRKNWHNFERESEILRNIFCKNSFSDDKIQQYKILHNNVIGYGISSMEYFDEICLFIEELKPKKVLDYGCGKGKLIACLKEKYPHITFVGYDPAVDEFSNCPDMKFDLVINTDVLEHIPENSLENVIKHIAQLSENVYFALHHSKAVATLPNGENAHCTVKSPEWYKDLISKYFNTVKSFKGQKYYLSTLITFNIPEETENQYKNLINKHYNS